MIEVPAIYKLLFSEALNDSSWIEAIVSNGQRRCKRPFATNRRKDSIWVRVVAVNRYGEVGWRAIWEIHRNARYFWSPALSVRAAATPASPSPTLEDLVAMVKQPEVEEE